MAWRIVTGRYLKESQAVEQMDLSLTRAVKSKSEFFLKQF